MKYFIYIISLLLSLEASNVNFDIFNDISIYENDNNHESLKYKKAKESNRAEFVTYYDNLYQKYKLKKIKEFTITYDVNKFILKNNIYYLTIIADRKSLVDTNAKYEIINSILVVKIDKNIQNKIYFKYKYDKPKRIEYRNHLINSFEYKYLLHYEGILYGLSYGIILCAFLYYLLIFFTTFEKAFLYYSVMQLFVLLTLISFTYLSYKSYPTYLEQMITDIFETSSFLFTLLFAKEVLYTKTKMKYMNIVFNIFILLNIMDLIAIVTYGVSILYTYIPFYLTFFLTFIAGIISIFQKNYYAIFYTLGWSIICLFVYAIQKDLLSLSGIYVVHLAGPLESLVLSFALALTLKKIVNDKNEKEKLLIHKSKLESMGEMINNIAHQWRQPLMHLGYINMNLQLASDDNDLGKKYLDEKINESNEQLEFMSKTIDNFRDFYKPSKDKEYFKISSATIKAIDIMKPIIETYKIELEVKILNDKEIKAYENEYSQVILNLITNAKDVLLSRKIKLPRIIIIVDNNITTVCDNAGGIESKYIDKIFEPYFTTKDNGSGIGLYMSKTIIVSHFQGSLEVENKLDGACFNIKV